MIMGCFSLNLLPGQSDCSTALNLDTSSINCTQQTINSPSIVWLKFKADSAYMKLDITSSPSPLIDSVEIYAGTCSSLTLSAGYDGADSSNGKQIQFRAIVDQLYYVKVYYESNSSSSTALTVCKSHYPPPAQACPPQSCSYIFQEPFTHFTTICNACCGGTCNGGCAALSTCTSYTNAFNSNVPCWGNAWGSPQIKTAGGNDYAYMWSGYAVGGAPPGGCGTLLQWGEGIYRDLPASLNPANLYIFEYKYRVETASDNQNLVDNFSILMTQQGSNNWTGVGSFDVPNMNNVTTLDNMSAITNTVFATRRICFYPPAGTSYDQLVFYPTTNATHPCVQQSFNLDDVALTEIKSFPIASSNTICSGQQVTLSNTCGYATSLVNYSWTPSTGLSCSTCSATTASPTATTTYTLTISAVGTSTTCNSIAGVVTVSVTPIPTISISPSSNPACSGQTTTLTASGANSYTWDPGGSTSNPITVSPNSTTTYTVTGAVSTCTSTAVLTLTVNPTPTLTVNSYTICNGSSTTVTVTGAGSGGTYSWTPSTGLSATTGTSVVASPTTTTAYTVSGTDSFGCTGTATFTITVRPKPTLSASANPAVICTAVSTNTTALSSVTNGHAIAWTAPASATLSCTSCSNPVATLSGTGVFTFTVVATNTVTTCTNTTTVSVTVHPVPDVAVTSATICPGSVATLTAWGASTYTWSANAGSATTATVSVSPTSTTVYTVTGTDANGCSSSATSTVTVLPVTTPVFSGTLCAGVAGTLTVSSGAGYTYTWSPSTGTNSVSPATGPTVTVNNPSGTYTVIATNTANSCTVSGTYATNPLPSISISTAPTNSYCAYSPTTVTLSATGASTYTWSANAGGGTASTATVMPSSTTSYTVTGTSSAGCQNTATTTITVVPTPTISVTASPTVICQGASSTLTASGASSYTWDPSGSLSSSTGATVTATPTANTTYTITGAVSTCTATGTITLNVTPSSTISIAAAPYGACNYAAPGNTSICAGASITFTATSGGALSSYTWTPGPITGSVVTVTPTVTTTYTVSGTGSGCPASNTITVNVSNCPCSGTALPALTNTTIAGGNYVVAPSTTVTVTGNVTLSGTDIKMGADAVILVPNGAVLRISGSHLSSCYNMWKGIVVDPGGQLDVNNNSLIEDAKVAIDNNPTNTVQTGNPSIVQVNGATFNCNRTGIRRAFYQSSNDPYYGTTYFRVNDAVITCRCSIPFPVTTSTLTVYSNTVTGTPNLSAPDLSDYYSVQNYTSANLRPPFAGVPAYEGVHLENLGIPAAQSASPLPYINVVGDLTLVLFDNHTYGINAINATFENKQSAFQNPRVLGNGSRSSPWTGAYAISAVNTQPDWYNGIYVNNSRFIKWMRAIHSTNYFDFDINTNVVWGDLWYASGGVMPAPPWYGEYGMYLSTVRFFEADIRTNNMADLYNGVVFSIGSSSTYNGGNGQYVGRITVGDNDLIDQFSGNSYTNRLIGTGIAISNVLTPNSTSTTTPTAGTGSFINVTRNDITNAWNGIYMSNHQWQKVRTEQNTIALKYHPTSTSTEHIQYGIQHANCFYSSGTSGYGNDIYDNTVTGYFASTYTFSSSNQAAFERKKGIWSRSCGNHYVTCNDVYHNGRGFEWEGVHMNNTTYWAQNTMNHNGEGHCLINNGTISTQSTSTNNANDNQWLSTANTFADTYVDANSFASNGILWLQNNTLPLGPMTNLGPGQFYSYGSGWLVQPKAVCTYSCSTIPPLSRMGEENNDDANARTAEVDSLDLSYLEDIVQDNIVYPSYSVQNTFINKNSVYRMLKRNSDLLSKSAVLAGFYTSSAGSTLDKFSVIEDSLSSGNCSYANSLLNTIVPTSSIESNYSRFYRIYSATMTGTLSLTDSSDLHAIASSCPMLNGTVVFQARALRNSVLNSFYNYDDNCPEDNGSHQKSSTKEIANSSGLHVYPNPSNGKLYVSNIKSQDKVILVEITDVTGKMVVRQKVQNVKGVIELNVDLNNGVYLIKVKNEDKEDQNEMSGKIIISK